MSVTEPQRTNARKSVLPTLGVPFGGLPGVLGQPTPPGGGPGGPRCPGGGWRRLRPRQASCCAPTYRRRLMRRRKACRRARSSSGYGLARCPIRSLKGSFPGRRSPQPSLSAPRRSLRCALPRDTLATKDCKARRQRRGFFSTYLRLLLQSACAAPTYCRLSLFFRVPFRLGIRRLRRCFVPRPKPINGKRRCRDHRRKCQNKYNNHNRRLLCVFLSLLSSFFAIH